MRGERAQVARALTLVESSRTDHRERATRLLAELRHATGSAHRVGISGIPGVGKSTFIDALGTLLTSAGHRVAVLAVDPSSSRSGGSVLGDKTRMHRLSVDPAAFVRASPSSGTLGGVARATREAVLVMEAAGYDVVLVETVGVGQSEFAVASMVDTFLHLALAGTGDQLQGIKRGVLELADVVAVTKADSSRRRDAIAAARELAGALQVLRGRDERIAVLVCSAVDGTGVDDVWRAVAAHRAALVADGRLEQLRRRQQVEWSRTLVRGRLLEVLEAPRVSRTVADAEACLLNGTFDADQAAQAVLSAVRAEPLEVPDTAIGPPGLSAGACRPAPPSDAAACPAKESWTWER